MKKWIYILLASVMITCLSGLAFGAFKARTSLLGLQIEPGNPAEMELLEEAAIAAWAANTVDIKRQSYRDQGDFVESVLQSVEHGKSFALITYTEPRGESRVITGLFLYPRRSFEELEDAFAAGTLVTEPTFVWLAGEKPNASFNTFAVMLGLSAPIRLRLNEIVGTRPEPSKGSCWCEENGMAIGKNLHPFAKREE